MNWKALKLIYREVLGFGHKIKYYGENKYTLITKDNYWLADFKNDKQHGRDIAWDRAGRMCWYREYKNGFIIKELLK